MALRMVTEADETEPEWLREASDVLSASPSASAPASVRAATPADDIALAQQVADALAVQGGPRSLWRPVPRAPAASQAAASQAAATASKTAQAVRQLARVCSQLESLHAHSELSTRFHSWHSAARVSAGAELAATTGTGRRSWIRPGRGPGKITRPRERMR
jgi:hypothetical protein